MAQTIITSQAPNAKPSNSIAVLNTDWQTLVSVDNYEIPVPGFGGQTRVAPGVAEITSPLVLSNTSAQTQLVSVQIVRDGSTTFLIADQIPVESNDIVYIPLNGQFLLSESQDELQVKAETNGNVTAMISFTQGQSEENDPLGN